MNTTRNLLLLMILTLAMTLLPACSGDDDPMAVGPQTFDAVIVGGGTGAAWHPGPNGNHSER